VEVRQAQILELLLALQNLLKLLVTRRITSCHALCV
jgi:hypothetical protein